MINAGDYKHRIKIVRFIDQEDSFGYKIKVEVHICNSWAKILNYSGNTLFKNGSDFEKVSSGFFIRFNKNVERGDYIVYKDEYYRIDYCRNINETNTELELQAIKEVL